MQRPGGDIVDSGMVLRGVQSGRHVASTLEAPWSGRVARRELVTKRAFSRKRNRRGGISGHHRFIDSARDYRVCELALG